MDSITIEYSCSLISFLDNLAVSFFCVWMEGLVFVCFWESQNETLICNRLIRLLGSYKIPSRMRDIVIYTIWKEGFFQTTFGLRFTEAQFTGSGVRLYFRYNTDYWDWKLYKIDVHCTINCSVTFFSNFSKISCFSLFKTSSWLPLSKSKCSPDSMFYPHS